MIIVNDDFKRDDGKFACLGCHNPHASKIESLFNADDKQDICLKCHKQMIR